MALPRIGSEDAPPYDAHTLAMAGGHPTDDGVRWLAMVLRQGLLLIVRAIEARYGLTRAEHKKS